MWLLCWACIIWHASYDRIMFWRSIFVVKLNNDIITYETLLQWLSIRWIYTVESIRASTCLLSTVLLLRIYHSVGTSIPWSCYLASVNTVQIQWLGGRLKKLRSLPFSCRAVNILEISCGARYQLVVYMQCRVVLWDVCGCGCRDLFCSMFVIADVRNVSFKSIHHTHWPSELHLF